MSLINDALKRAKEAQTQGPQPPLPTLKFRPVDPRETAPERFTWVLPSLIAIIVVFLVFVVWQLSHTRKSASSGEANAPSALNSAATPKATTPAAAAFIPGKPLKVHARDNETSPGKALAASSSQSQVPHIATEKVGVVAVSPTTVVEETRPDKNASANGLASPEDAPMKPAPPRLQAIVFNPAQPSAMISGKTLFVGDKLGNLTVVAIGRESATLVGAGQTNVLTLP